MAPRLRKSSDRPGDRIRYIPESKRRSRLERWKMGWTLRGTLSREGPSLTFRLHLSQRAFMLRPFLRAYDD